MSKPQPLIVPEKPSREECQRVFDCTLIEFQKFIAAQQKTTKNQNRFKRNLEVKEN